MPDAAHGPAVPVPDLLYDLEVFCAQLELELYANFEVGELLRELAVVGLGAAVAVGGGASTAGRA